MVVSFDLLLKAIFILLIFVIPSKYIPHLKNPNLPMSKSDTIFFVSGFVIFIVIFFYIFFNYYEPLTKFVYKLNFTR